MKNSPVAVKHRIVPVVTNYDKFLSFILLKQYGELMFPGFGTADITYVNGQVHGNDEYFDKEAQLPIGCGQGRFSGNNVTAKVATYLDLWGDPVLSRLLNEVIRNNRFGKTSPTQLSSIIMAVNRSQSGKPAEVVRTLMQFSLTMTEAILVQERVPRVEVEGEKSFFSIFKSMIADGFCKNHPMVKQTLFNYVKASDENPQHLVTEMSHVVECLYRKGYDEKVVMKWVTYSLQALEADQIAYQEVLELIRKIPPIQVEAIVNRVPRTLKLVVVEGNSPQAHRAAKTAGADIVLLVNTSHNCQIFVRPGIYMGNLKAMILWQELPPKLRKSVNWHELCCRGTYQDVPKWHLGYQILSNGTETQPRDPTTLPTKILISTIKNSCSWKLVEAWCRDRGIRITRRPRKQASQPTKPTSVPETVAELVM